MGELKSKKSILILLLALALAAPIGTMRAQERERVFDQVVSLQDSLLTVIPAVTRLCDSGDLARRRVRVGDVELYVEEAGTGPALVLINGGPGGTHHYFHPWFDRAHDFARVVYYDQRGTGLSDYAPGPEGYSVEQAVEDLDALRSALEIDRWIVLGHSYGGFLAQYYAVRHPERVAGLVLVASSTGTWSQPRRGRTYRYISSEERERLAAIRTELAEWADHTGIPDSLYISLLVYNRFLNGDWKRQYLYRPSGDRMARMALYEWTDQGEFRSQISRSQRRLDFTGAFRESPIPTWIVEGRWDLTWDTDKPAFIHANQPQADLTVFGMAGHEVFADEPDKFFDLLRGFVSSLQPVGPAELAAYGASLREWEAELHGKPQYLLRSVTDGRESSERIAEAFSLDWLPDLAESSDYFVYLQRVGLALYDTRDYEGALAVFGKMLEAAERDGRQERIEAWVPLVWQGHMLDLIGRREEAIAKYRLAVRLGLTGHWGYQQYGLQYQCTDYASKWLERPFVRIENLFDGGR